MRKRESEKEKGGIERDKVNEIERQRQRKKIKKKNTRQEVGYDIIQVTDDNIPYVDISERSNRFIF